MFPLGVIPGRGVTGASPQQRRVTFMVGFWKRIQAVLNDVDCPGPGQPFPDRNICSLNGTSYDEGKSRLARRVSNYTWHKEMNLIEGKEDTTSTECSLVDPIPIDRIWEPVQSLAISDAGVSGEPTCEPSDSLTEKPSIVAAHYKSCFQGF